MVHRRLVFALFSAAILVSMVREWNAPVSCALRQIDPGCAGPTAEAAVPATGPSRKSLAPLHGNRAHYPCNAHPLSADPDPSIALPFPLKRNLHIPLAHQTW